MSKKVRKIVLVRALDDDFDGLQDQALFEFVYETQLRIEKLGSHVRNIHFVPDVEGFGDYQPIAPLVVWPK